MTNMPQKVVFTPDIVDRTGPIDKVLEDFLFQQTNAVQSALEKKFPGVSKSATQRLLNEFVSLEGTKKPKARSAILVSGIDETQAFFILQQLEKGRILSESDGIYEVAHDTLAKIIADHRTDDEVALLEAVKLVKDRHYDYQKYKTLLIRKELAFLSRYESRLREYDKLKPDEWAFIKKSKKAANLRRGSLIVFLIALVMVSIATFSYVYAQKTLAVLALKKAKEESLKSRYALLSAQSISAQDDDNTLALQLAFAARAVATDSQTRENARAVFVDISARQDFPFYQLLIDSLQKVFALDVSPDGHRILTAGENGEAKAWDEKGRLLQTLEGGHTQRIQAAVYSPDGLIATGGMDSLVIIWKQDGSILHRRPNSSGMINALAFSPDGQYLLSGDADGWIKQYETKSGKLIHEFPKKSSGDGAVNCITFLPEGDHFLYGLENQRIRIKSLNGNWSSFFDGHTNEITSLSVSPDGEYFVSGSWDNTAILWEKYSSYSGPKFRKLLTLEGHEYNVNAVAVSPDGKHIVTGSEDNTIHLWDRQGNLARVFYGHSGEVTALKWLNPDVFISGSRDMTVKVWHISPLYPIVMKNDWHVLQARFDTKDRVITASRNGNIYRWWLSSGQVDTLVKTPNQITDFFVLPDKKLLVYGDKKGNIGLAFERKDTIIVKEVKGPCSPGLEKYNGCITKLILSPDQTSFLSVGLRNEEEHTASLYEIQGDTIIKSHIAFGPNRHPVLVASFFPQSGKAVTADVKGNIFIWAPDGKLLNNWKGHANQQVVSVAVSHNEAFLATGGWDNDLIIWDTTGKKIQSFIHGKPVRSIAFSKNDSLLLTGSNDNWARLFKFSNGKWQLEQRFEGHSGTIWSVSFSPDERQVLTGSLDNTARIWKIIDSTFMNSNRIAPLTEKQKMQYGFMIEKPVDTPLPTKD